MNKKVLASLIGAGATIAAAFIGKDWGEKNAVQQLFSQVTTVNGSDNIITINSVDDFITQYNNLLQENEILKSQNSQYFMDYTEQKNISNSLESKLEERPDVLYSDLGLCVNADDIPINKNNSMVTIDGRDYLSKEIAEKLIPDDQNMTIKGDTLFIGKVIADKTNLLDQYQMGISWCKIEDSITDSFGNICANAIHFWHFQSGYVMYNLEEKYLNLKCKISGTSKSPMEGGSTVYIIADDNIIYTSPQINKLTDPYEVDIPINNCKVLKIRVDNNTAIISDAILYN